MIKVRVMFIWLSVCFMSGGLAFAAPSLSDREARALAARELSYPTTIPLGQFDVLGGLNPGVKTNLERREITESALESLKLWENVGVIRIYNKSLRDKKDFTLQDLNATVGRGLVGHVTITPTQRGQALGHVDVTKNELVIPDSAKVESLVKNEELKRDVDEYRIIMGAVSYARSPEAWAVRGALISQGSNISHREKFILLLKFDPFSNKWKSVAADEIPENLEFRTHNVSRALGQ